MSMICLKMVINIKIILIQKEILSINPINYIIIYFILTLSMVKICVLYENKQNFQLYLL